MSRYIDLDELLKYPIRINNYDKEHGDVNFVYGIESVLEYAEYLPVYETLPVKPDDTVLIKIAKNTLTSKEALRLLNTLKATIPNKIMVMPDNEVELYTTQDTDN